MHPHIPNYLLSGNLPGLTGNAHPNISPYDKFPTRTVDGVPRGRQRPGVRAAVRRARRARAGRRPALSPQPRPARQPRRRSPRSLAALLADQDGEALCQRLLAAGVPAGPVRDVAQVWSDAHTRHRGMAAEQDGYRGFGLPIKLSRTPGRVARTPPRFGAHGREILEQFGFAAAEIEGLIAAGVVLEQRRR